MRKYKWTTPHGGYGGVVGADKVSCDAPSEIYAANILDLRPGEKYVDEDGDTWERVE